MNVDRLPQAESAQRRDEPHYRALLGASTVPEHIHEGLVEYLVNHHRPGSFLTAVLSDQLLQAVKRGDAMNRTHLSDLVLWLYAHAEIDAWGSPDAVETWVR